MKERSQYLEANYRAVFLMEYGDFPHPCYFCGGEVKGYLVPRDGQSAIVHHVDHDKGNNNPENLVPGHRKCHTDYHRLSPETQARQRASQLARWARDGKIVLSAESRAKISASKMGHEVSEETRAKIRATKAANPWRPSVEVREKMSAASRGKPKSAAHRANIAAARRGKPSAFQGSKHSEASIEKMREARQRRPLRLSPEQQAEIVEKYAAGTNQVALAAEYDVSQPYVSNIIRRQRDEVET